MIDTFQLALTFSLRWEGGDKEKTNKAIELALGAEMTKEQIMRGVKASIVQRNKTRLDAMTTNRHGIPHSTEQKRKYIERLQYE